MKQLYKLKRFLLFFSLLLGMTASAVNGATITLTAPTSPVSFADGEDFFTDVENDPVDFDRRRDIKWEEHFTESTVGISNGVWSGEYDGVTAGGAGAYIFPLFNGVPGGLSTGISGVESILDSSKYRFVSVMDRVSNSTLRRMYWSHDDGWPGVTCPDCKTKGSDGSFLVGNSGEGDGICTDGINFCSTTSSSFIAHAPDQWVIYLIDLRAKSEWTDLNVTGIRFDASPKGPLGTAMDFNWFRAIDPDTSPVLDITWSTDNAPGGAKVNIYIDTDGVADDYNGAFVTRVPYGDGAFSFPSAALPAGEYYVYLRLMDNVGSDTELARSDYSAKITIDGKGHVTFLSPSKTSGPDYATEVLENPWDMETAADLENLSLPSYQQCFVDETFTDSAMTARAVIDPQQSNTAHTDVQLWMTVDDQAPIDTSRYRYLSYTLEVNTTGFGNISNKVANGWISRIIWWSDGLGIDGEQTNDNLVYEGLHTYTLDLSTVEIEPASPLSGTLWTGEPTVAHLRIDPLETSNPGGTWFYLHDVKLTGDPEPQNNIFKATVRVNDPENQKLDVDFYLDTDPAGFDGEYLGGKNFSPGIHDFTFKTCKLPDGYYYLYVVMTDPSGNVTRRYADAPINIGISAVPADCPVPDIQIIHYMLF